MSHLAHLRTILFLRLLIFYGQAYSQSYHPILKDSSTWYVLRKSWGYTTESFCNKGEAFINDVTYRVIGSVEDAGIIAYVREDTLEKKVYQWICDKEVLLYDFSMKVGDSIFYRAFHNCNSVIIDIGWYHLDSIKPVKLENETRNAYYLSGSDPYFLNPIWIEGIGSIGYFVYPFEEPDTFNVGILNCFYERGTIIYQSDFSKKIGDCYYDTYNGSVGYLQKKIRIFPNPAKTSITIDGLSDFTYLAVIDILGNVICSKNLNCIPKIELNIAKWQVGMYFILLYPSLGDDISLGTAKFIKE